ncbi:MAG: ComEA family DNA-binding protein [Chloroflexota bacterium]
MKGEGWRRVWLVLFLFTLFALITGSLFLYSSIPRAPSWELTLTTPTPYPLQRAYVEGEVTSPGLYPIDPQSSLEELLQAAGGLGAEADAERLKVLVPRREETSVSQRVNINTAQPWLLMALPGIGEGLAQAIVADREQQGAFRNPLEIMRVKGIGPKLYDSIKDLITVGD